jgi:choline dehydrogenase-like flavoprotein
VGIDLNESAPRAGRCIRYDRFDGFPCLTDGKADAHIRCVRPALRHPNVTLLTHAHVQRLEPDAPGHTVTRIVVNREGNEEIYGGDIVVVSCGAVNSAALLLRSASDKHPLGLANSSGVVGRHHMAHLNSAIIAVSRTPNETGFQKTLALNDSYWGAADSDLPLGHIQMLGKSDRDILRSGAPRLGPGLALDYIARHSVDFWLTTEDLPHPRNPVTIDRHGNIHLAKTYLNTETHRRLLAKLKDLVGALG